MTSDPIKESKASLTLNGQNPMGKLGELQLQTVKHAQERILNGWQKSVNGWCGSQQTRIDALAEFSNAAVRAKSPLDLAQAWMQWSTGAMKRFSEDLTNQTDHMFAAVRQSSVPAGKHSNGSAAVAE
jgi:hypothetical protein